jgi:hypothetical protein
MVLTRTLLLAAALVLALNMCQVLCLSQRKSDSPLVHRLKAEKCTDKYGSHEKQKKLNEYKMFLEKSSRLRSLQVVGDTLSVNLANRTNLFEESQCLLRTRNTTTVCQKSLCPWRNDATYREDRWPEFIAEAKCTCSTCNHLIKDQLPSTYGCLPILEPVSVLVRSCGLDGIYKWTPEIEFASIGCTCVLKYIINI